MRNNTCAAFHWVSTDLANAGLYAIEGDAVNAGLSLAAAVPVVGTAVAVGKVAKGAKIGKAIVIGEGMEAVKATAKALQSKGINAKWYQAWSKNFPGDRLMTSAELDAALSRNIKWIDSKISKGYTVYDIGIDATRATRSPFYQLEKSLLQKSNYPTIRIQR